MSPEKDIDTKEPESSVKEPEQVIPAGVPDGKAKGDAPEAGGAQKLDVEKSKQTTEAKVEDGGGDRNGDVEAKPKEERQAKQNRRLGTRGPPRGKPKRRRFRRERESQSEAEGAENDSAPVVAKPQRQRRTRENSEAQTRPDLDEDIPESHRYKWDDIQRSSLFIGNLTLNVTKQDVQNLSDAIVSVRFVTRRSAIVDFASEDVANEQLESLKGTEMQGEEIFVEHLRPREPQVKSDRDLYVRGIPEDYRMDKLGTLFPDAQLVERQSAKIRLRFNDHESALAAIKEAIAQEGNDFKFSFAAARPRWNRRGPVRAGFRRRYPPRQETRQD